MPRVALAVSLVLLVVVAGCAATAPGGTGTPTPRDVSVTVTNDGDAPIVATFSVAPDPVEGFRVTYANDTSVRFADADSVDDLPPRAVAEAVSLVPLGPDVRSRRFDLNPGEGIGTTFEAVPRNATLIGIIADPTEDAPMRTVGIERCGPDASFVRVEYTIRGGGYIDSAVSCEG